MRKYVVLGGYGEMGRIASLDLAKTARNAKIIVAGRDEKKAGAYAKKLGKNVSGAGVDATNQYQLIRFLKGADVCVNCTNYYYNLDVMKACLAAGCSYVDLGGLFHTTNKQLRFHASFRKKSLTAVLGCGSTPGITNVMAAYGSNLLDRTETIRVRFAGYSFTKQKTHFVVPYSMYTVFDEFTAEPAVFEKGRLKFVKPMSGKGKEEFPEPVGKVTSFYTLHSEIATFPSSFRKKGLKNCDFKVAFDDDFVHDVSLLVETGLASKNEVEISGHKVRPIDITVKELNRFIPERKKTDDIEYVRVVLTGKKDRKKKQLTVDCLARSVQKWHASAGDVDTGVPPSIIAQMIASGKIKQKGVFPPELCVPQKEFFAELEKRRMKIIMSEKAI